MLGQIMKNTILTGSLFMLGLSLVVMSVNATEVKSLRTSLLIDDASDVAEIKKNINDKSPIKRDYLQQPPLIPHKITGYKINLKFNKCLTCHSWANYKKSGATKVSQTHFTGRDGEPMSNLAPRRYFCTQCHVPQVDAVPIVENTFKSVQSIR